mmetsp:Transcript_8058/g.23835  ORF Transcript_8058/g.23835 Transcript_8058/m.23835 type:complete len:378 (-) Transcript_8058:237-1370(-)
MPIGVVDQARLDLANGRRDGNKDLHGAQSGNEQLDLDALPGIGKGSTDQDLSRHDAGNSGVRALAAAVVGRIEAHGRRQEGSGPVPVLPRVVPMRVHGRRRISLAPVGSVVLLFAAVVRCQIPLQFQELLLESLVFQDKGPRRGQALAHGIEGRLSPQEQCGQRQRGGPVLPRHAKEEELALFAEDLVDVHGLGDLEVLARAELRRVRHCQRRRRRCRKLCLVPMIRIAPISISISIPIHFAIRGHRGKRPRLLLRQQIVQDGILEIVLPDVCESVPNAPFAELVHRQAADPTRGAIQNCRDPQFDQVVHVARVVLVANQDPCVLFGCEKQPIILGSTGGRHRCRHRRRRRQRHQVQRTGIAGPAAWASGEVRWPFG